MQENGYKGILFFDIDGTIITDDGRHYIPESTRQALTQARARGYLVCINTGRVYLNIEPRIRELGFDGYVCGCGTNIIFRDQVLLHHEIPAELQKETWKRVHDSGMNVIYEAFDMNALDIPRDMNADLSELVDYFTKDGRLLVSVDSPEFHYDKFTGWYWKEDQDKHDALRQYLSRHFEYIDRGTADGCGMCEIVPKGFSKGTGIQFLLERLGLDMENCYVFGDSTNDLPMFRAVKHSVAMGGSAKEVTDLVEYITEGIMEDGLYHAMQHYGIL